MLNDTEALAELNASVNALRELVDPDDPTAAALVDTLVLQLARERLSTAAAAWAIAGSGELWPQPGQR